MNKKARLMGVSLTGDKNQCQGCMELFRSSHAFDKHRRGELGDRHCLTEAEMLERGMAKKDNGFWVGSLMNTDVLDAITADKEPA